MHIANPAQTTSANAPIRRIIGGTLRQDSKQSKAGILLTFLSVFESPSSLDSIPAHEATTICQADGWEVLPLEATDHPTLSWQAGFNVDYANLAGQRGASRNEVLRTEEVNRTTSVSVSVVQSESELRSLCGGSKGAAR